MASFDHSRAAGPRPPTGPAGRSEATADPPGGSNGNVVPVTTTSTLSVDCGGGGIKASVLDAEGAIVSRAVRTPTPYPLPPTKLVETIAGLAEQLPRADRVTVGMPGMIRHGVVIATPHYITRDGPRSRVLPELVEQWARFDMGGAVSTRLAIPALVLNDAEVAG